MDGPDIPTIDEIQKEWSIDEPQKTTKKKVTKKKVTKSSEPAPGKPHLDTPEDRAGVEMHPCGLPMDMVEDHSILAGYLQKWEITPAMRREMLYTEAERKRFEAYRQKPGGKFRVAKDFFVAALRLYVKGYPVEGEDRIDLSKMQVEA